MSSTLSLEASKKVFEIVGEYETEKCWLTLNGCNDATRGDFSIQYEGGKTVLYKRIGVYGE